VEGAGEPRRARGSSRFITASSWLTGPGFVGLRKLARDQGDEMWTVDLGGDNSGANPEPNVFNIQTPVAITTMLRAPASPPQKRPLRTTANKRSSGAEKLAVVKGLQHRRSALAGDKKPGDEGWKLDGPAGPGRWRRGLARWHAPRWRTCSRGSSRDVMVSAALWPSRRTVRDA
jgi:hypothetical protein